MRVESARAAHCTGLFCVLFSDESALRGEPPRGNIPLDRFGRPLRTRDLQDIPWQAPSAVVPSTGYAHPPPDDDINDELLYEVHVQVVDRHGSSYVDWVVLKTFRAFWELHAAVCAPTLQCCICDCVCVCASVRLCVWMSVYLCVSVCLVISLSCQFSENLEAICDFPGFLLLALAWYDSCPRAAGMRDPEARRLP